MKYVNETNKISTASVELAFVSIVYISFLIICTPTVQLKTVVSRQYIILITMVLLIHQVNVSIHCFVLWVVVLIPPFMRVTEPPATCLPTTGNVHGMQWGLRTVGCLRKVSYWQSWGHLSYLFDRKRGEWRETAESRRCMWAFRRAKVSMATPRITD
jgi:hypothetical protein